MKIVADTRLKSLDYLEAGFLALFATFALTSWVGFTLAEFGQDQPIVVLALGVVSLITGEVVVFRRAWRRVDLASFAGLTLPVVLGVALYFPPDEWILGALDPGSYVNAGATIARTGGIVLHSPTLAELDPATRAALFPSPASRLPGFYLMFAHFDGFVPRGFEVSTDRVVPHGFHLYPAILAFGYAAGGIWTELLVTPILAVAGLVAFYLLVRRLFGTPVGSGATFLLAIGPAEVWFARYPDAEILAQLLLMGGFLAFVVAIDGSSSRAAALAGLALGLVHLAKIEMVPLPFLIAAYLGYQWLTDRLDRCTLWFVIPYGILLVQATLHAALIANWYAVTTFRGATSVRFLAAVGVALILALIVAFILLRAPVLRERIATILGQPSWEKGLSWALPALIGGLAIYAYFIRPVGVLSIPASQLNPMQLSEVNNLLSFRRLGWFVSPLGLFLGTLGWAFVAHQERNRRTLLLLLVIAADTVIFMSDMKIVPLYYWAARRWVPLVIPGFCLAAAYFLNTLIPRQRADLFRAAVPVGLGLVMTLQLLESTRPLLGYVEYRGAIKQIGELATRFPANSVVLFADGDSGQRLSTPLNYLFDRTSLVIANDTGLDAAAGMAARRWLREGRPVYWITTAGLPGPKSIGLSGTVIAHQTISLPEKVATRDTPPGQDAIFYQELTIWRLSDSDWTGSSTSIPH